MDSKDPQKHRGLLDTFAAMSDEAKELCIHCKKEWYVMRHTDGVCHTCKNILRLPGRTEMARSTMHRERIFNVLIGFVILVIVLWSWGFIPASFIPY